MKERESGRSICFGSRCRNEIKRVRWRASDKMESGQESEEARNAAGATKHAYIHWALRIDHFEQKVRPSIILMIGFRHLNIFPPILYTFKDEEEGREARLKRESERDGGRRRRRRRRREREREILSVFRISHLLFLSSSSLSVASNTGGGGRKNRAVGFFHFFFGTVIGDDVSRPYQRSNFLGDGQRKGRRRSAKKRYGSHFLRSLTTP